MQLSTPFVLKLAFVPLYAEKIENDLPIRLEHRDLINNLKEHRNKFYKYLALTYIFGNKTLLTGRTIYLIPAIGAGVLTLQEFAELLKITSLFERIRTI